MAIESGTDLGIFAGGGAPSRGGSRVFGKGVQTVIYRKLISGADLGILGGGLHTHSPGANLGYLESGIRQSFTRK